MRDAVAGAGVSPAVFDDPVAAAEAALAAGAAADMVLAALIEGLAPEDEAALGGARELAERFRGDERPRIARSIAERYSPEEARVRAGALAFLVFEHRVEDTLVQPTFLCDFPLAVSPLARRKESDPSLVDRFELFIGGREYANGFSELNDPDDQRSRFQAQLRAREHGSRTRRWTTTRTTAAPSRSACRRRPARASASTDSPCCSPISPRSGTSSCFPRCAPRRGSSGPPCALLDSSGSWPGAT